MDYDCFHKSFPYGTVPSRLPKTPISSVRLDPEYQPFCSLPTFSAFCYQTKCQKHLTGCKKDRKKLRCCYPAAKPITFSGPVILMQMMSCVSVRAERHARISSVWDPWFCSISRKRVESQRRTHSSIYQAHCIAFSVMDISMKIYQLFRHSWESVLYFYIGVTADNRTPRLKNGATGPLQIACSKTVHLMQDLIE